MAIVNIHEAKTHFSQFLNRVQNGEEIIIAKNGNPIAKIISIEKKNKKRIPGLLKGKIKISEDFNDNYKI